MNKYDVISEAILNKLDSNEITYEEAHMLMEYVYVTEMKSAKEYREKKI